MTQNPHATPKKLFPKAAAGWANAGNRRGLILPVLISVLSALLYLSSLDLAPYADDFHSWSRVELMGDRPLAELLLHPYNPEFFRPFEHLLIRANLLFVGSKPVLYHLVTILGHALSCLAVFFLAMRLGFGRWAGVLAALLFGVHQTNAMAVLSCDTAGQVWSTLFGTLCLLSLLSSESPNLKRIALSSLFLLLSLLWKEAGISTFAAAVFLLIFPLQKARKPARIVLLSLPLIAAVLFYLVLRTQAGAELPRIGDLGRYQISFGANLVRNPLLILLSLVTPVGSTVIVTRSLSTPFLAAVGLAAALSAFLPAWGLVSIYRERPEMRRPLGLLLGLFLISFFPECFMARISELYTYKNCVFFSIFAGLGLSQVLRVFAGGRLLSRLLISVIISIFLASHVSSVKHKESLMRRNGIMAAHFLRQIKTQVPAISPQTAAVLANAGSGCFSATCYSIYTMKSVDLLGGPQVFEKLYGVPLVRWRIVDQSALESTCEALRMDCLIGVLSKGDIRVRFVPKKKAG